MENQHYNAVIAVKASPTEVLNRINAVSTWWTENTEGSSQNSGDVFTVRFDETFVTFKIMEAVPAQKVVWHVTDCYLHWLTDKKEWKDTKISFGLSTGNKTTQIRFTHIGLVAGMACFNDCAKGWDQYIKGSLFKLITEGKGLPERKKIKEAVA